LGQAQKILRDSISNFQGLYIFLIDIDYAWTLLQMSCLVLDFYDQVVAEISVPCRPSSTC